MRTRLARLLLAAAKRLDPDVVPSGGSIVGPPRALINHAPRAQVGDRVRVHVQRPERGPVRNGDTGTITWSGADHGNPWVAQVELDTFRPPNKRWDFLTSHLERIDDDGSVTSRP